MTITLEEVVELVEAFAQLPRALAGEGARDEAEDLAGLVRAAAAATGSRG
ncbi:hypothetical protein [Lentzea sp. NPDC051838]